VREKFLMSRLLEDWLDLLASYERRCVNDFGAFKKPMKHF
jgi:hypothetical protein